MHGKKSTKSKQARTEKTRSTDSLQKSPTLAVSNHHHHHRLMYNHLIFFATDLTCFSLAWSLRSGFAHECDVVALEQNAPNRFAAFLLDVHLCCFVQHEIHVFIKSLLSAISMETQRMRKKSANQLCKQKRQQ